MAHYRTSPALRAHRELAAFKATGFALLTLLGMVGLTGAAQAPGPASAATPERIEVASLTRAGEDLIITGSVHDMFRSAAFSGPNIVEKQDRARPGEDAVQVSARFADVRARLAALRQPAMPAIIPVVETASAGDGQTAAPTLVAAIDPMVESSALDAIDQFAGGAPVPATMSKKLAYARADLPATVFDGSVTMKTGSKATEKDVWCMATAIYFESRGESYRGQVAVGQVVMNRLAHRLYPKTICAVVFQNQHKRNACQFSFACDGIPERVTDQTAWTQANQIAKNVIAGTEYLPEVGVATHYHATYVYPHWAPRMKKVAKIGQHVFYQFKRGWQFG